MNKIWDNVLKVISFVKRKADVFNALVCVGVFSTSVVSNKKNSVAGNLVLLFKRFGSD